MLNVRVYKAVVGALAHYLVVRLPPTASHFWQQNDSQARMEITVLQSPSCRLHEGLGGAGVRRSAGSDVPVHPCLGLAQGVCISKLPRTGVSPGKLSPD